MDVYRYTRRNHQTGATNDAYCVATSSEAFVAALNAWGCQLPHLWSYYAHDTTSIRPASKADLASMGPMAVPGINGGVYNISEAQGKQS